MILPQIQDAERSTNNVMAMADAKAANMKRSAAIKHLGDYSD
jgi:hypothetical protein